MILINNKEVQFEQFPNGETKLVHESLVEVLQPEEQMVYFKYQNDGDLIKLIFVKEFLDFLELPARLVIAYMPYSRMDRSEEYSPLTLKYVAKLINNMNFLKVAIIEPHSDVTPALIDNCVPIYINFELLPLVEKEIGFDKDHDYLFFPDAGAQKRYHSLKGYNQLVGFKNRDFHTGEIKSLEVVGFKDPAPSIKKVLIVDDLSSYGGTFLHSGNKLKELGFGEVHLLVAHCEDSIFEGKLLKEGSPIDRIFTTNTIISQDGIWTNKQYENKLKVFKMEDTEL